MAGSKAAPLTLLISACVCCQIFSVLPSSGKTCWLEKHTAVRRTQGARTAVIDQHFMGEGKLCRNVGVLSLLCSEMTSTSMVYGSCRCADHVSAADQQFVS